MNAENADSFLFCARSRSSTSPKERIPEHTSGDQNTSRKRRALGAWLLLSLGLIVVLVACGGESGDLDATAEALSQSIIQAATAQAAVSVDQGQVVATAEAEATAQGQEAAATQVAVATEVSLEQAATATAVAPIEAELRSYGIDPAAGRLGWVHPPVTIHVEDYLGFDYANQFLETVAADFVVAADITWNTQYGSAGCGFVVRSDGDEEAFNQYLIIGTRGAEGHVGFIVQRDGEISIDESEDIYANGIDPLFEWQNDTTNRFVIAGRGDTFTIYTNGTKIDEITTAGGLEKGFIAFVALNESGYTNCQYDNAWLWLMNE
jgi:hypothetical protein